MYICNKSDVRDDFSNNGEAQLELKLHPSYMNSLRRKRLRSEIERIETIERIKNFQTLALLLFPPRYFEILVVEGFLEASVPGGSSRDTAAEIRCNLRSRIHG